MTSRAVRLLIVEENRSGGTEVVSLGVVPEIAKLAECVVWAMPDPRMEFYQNIIPGSDRLIYERLFWPPKSRFFYRLDGMLRRMNALVPVSWKFVLQKIAHARGQIKDAWLRHLIRKYRITHFFTTWIFNQECVNLPVPIGAMVMDMNWHHFPENFPANDRRTLDELFGRWLDRADVVFPVSDFTAKEMRLAFPQASSRIEVVPHGARMSAQTSSGSRPLARGKLKRPYFYYPASVFAHKGHQTLVEAALKLFASGHDFDLLFSGGRTECFESQAPNSDQVSESIRKLCSENASLVAGRIKGLGNVPWAEVTELYEHARAVILPSRFEGFGLPLLESIERGVRVICTDIPPFHEQILRYDYGKYTTIFSAGDVNFLAEQMAAVLKAPRSDDPLPEEIAARIQRWTWRDAAVAYVDALSRVPFS
jgi:glycosyltransferase involved in cell wall biosynthesis